MENPDEESREIVLSFKKPYDIEMLKIPEIKDIKGKKTELKR